MEIRNSKYRTFSKSQLDMPIFSKDWYLDAVYTDEWDVITVERDGKIVASLPFFLKKKAFFKYIAQHSFTQTMGPYIIPEFRHVNMEMKLMKELIAQLPAFDAFEQSFHHGITNWLPFKWEGFQQTTQYTYVIEDITDLDKVWEGFSSNYRNKIRKAENLVEVVTDRSLADFYDTAKMTFDRQGMKMPYDLSFLERFDSRLYMECRNKVFFAQDKEGQIHSVLYLTLGDKSAYLHQAGENPELRNSGAGIYLIWEAIKYASQQEKLQSFDFQGSVIPSVEQVRRKCGAIQKPYFRVWKHNSNMYKLLKKIKG
jgi:lipid II:glycine glycyltransferase (peptidoglycan interpeptide bridge formation enzyme)